MGKGMTVSQDSLFKARENYYRFIMQKTGFTVDTKREFRNEILKFITYSKQITPFINSTCYNVIESNRITGSLINLRVKNKNLSLEYDIRLKYIKEDLKSGKYMLAYCSNRYSDQEKLDLLWLHWDIYHLHFKTIIDGRTDYLVFAMIKGNNIYMIDIKQHGHWTDQDLLCIVDENWRHLLIRPNSEILGHVLTSEEIKVLRDRGFNTLLRLPNGNHVMANSGVMGNFCHMDTFYSIRCEQEHIKGIFSQIQNYNFCGLTPQYLHINENHWAIVTLDKELKTFNLYYQGNFDLITKELQSLGILEETPKTIAITDSAVELLQQA